MIYNFCKFLDTKILRKKRYLEEEKGPRGVYWVIAGYVLKKLIVYINKLSSVYHLLIYCILINTIF